MAHGTNEIIREVEKIYSGMKTERESWINHWRDLGDYILPRRPRFLTDDRNQGKLKHSNIVDAAATLAAGALSSGMMSGITSPSRPWFRLTISDPVLADQDDVKIWRAEVEQTMRDIFIRSNLYNELPLMYSDLGVFGTTCTLILEDDEDVIRAYSLPIGSYCIGMDSRNAVNRLVREYSQTVSQLVEEFGLENCSSTVQELHREKQLDQWVDVLHAIIPNRDFMGEALESTRKAFRSVQYERRGPHEKLLRDGGFDEFPALAPRWSTTGEDVYGNSPAMDVLGDIKGLQILQKRKAQAIEKTVNPPMTGPTSLKTSTASILPGHITYVDVNNDRGSFRPSHEVRFDISGVLEDVGEHRARIDEAFHKNLFLMLANDRRQQPATAREIDERHEEKMLILGPVLERLNTEMLDPLINRTFSIMVRKRLVPEPPESIAGADMKIEYVSILAQAQKAVGIGSIENLATHVLGLAQGWPEALDKYNADADIDDVAEMLGTDPRLVRDAEEVEQIRVARAEQQAALAQQEQQMAQLEMAKGAAEVQSIQADAQANALGGLV